MINQTLSPLFEKKRELEVLINTLKSQCEIEGLKSKEAAEAVTDLNQRIENLKGLIEDVEKIGEEAVVVVSRVITEGIEATRQAIRGVDGAFELIRRLDTKVAESEAKLANMKDEQAVRLKAHSRRLRSASKCCD